MDESLFRDYGGFYNLGLWKLVMVVFGQLDSVLDLNLIFKEILSSNSPQTDTSNPLDCHEKKWCIKWFLSAQSSIHIILNHDLKKFYYNFACDKLNHNLIDLFESSEEAYLKFCLDIIGVSQSKEILFISGINKSIKGLLADEIITDDSKNHYLEKVLEHIQQSADAEKGKIDRNALCRVNHIEATIIGNFNKSSFGLPIIQENLLRVSNEINDILGSEEATSDRIWFSLLLKVSSLIQFHRKNPNSQKEGWIGSVN